MFVVHVLVFKKMLAFPLSLPSDSSNFEHLEESSDSPLLEDLTNLLKRCSELSSAGEFSVANTENREYLPTAVVAFAFTISTQG